MPTNFPQTSPLVRMDEYSYEITKSLQSNLAVRATNPNDFNNIINGYNSMVCNAELNSVSDQVTRFTEITPVGFVLHLPFSTCTNSFIAHIYDWMAGRIYINSGDEDNNTRYEIIRDYLNKRAKNRNGRFEYATKENPLDANSPVTYQGNFDNVDGYMNALKEIEEQEIFTIREGNRQGPGNYNKNNILKEIVFSDITNSSRFAIDNRLISFTRYTAKVNTSNEPFRLAEMYYSSLRTNISSDVDGRGLNIGSYNFTATSFADMHNDILTTLHKFYEHQRCFLSPIGRLSSYTDHIVETKNNIHGNPLKYTGENPKLGRGTIRYKESDNPYIREHAKKINRECNIGTYFDVIFYSGCEPLESWQISGSDPTKRPRMQHSNQCFLTPIIGYDSVDTTGMYYTTTEGNVPSSTIIHNTNSPTTSQPPQTSSSPQYWIEIEGDVKTYINNDINTNIQSTKLSLGGLDDVNIDNIESVIFTIYKTLKIDVPDFDDSSTIKIELMKLIGNKEDNTFVNYWNGATSILLSIPSTNNESLTIQYNPYYYNNNTNALKPVPSINTNETNDPIKTLYCPSMSNYDVSCIIKFKDGSPDIRAYTHNNKKIFVRTILANNRIKYDNTMYLTTYSMGFESDNTITDKNDHDNDLYSVDKFKSMLFSDLKDIVALDNNLTILSTVRSIESFLNLDQRQQLDSISKSIKETIEDVINNNPRIIPLVDYPERNAVIPPTINGLYELFRISSDYTGIHASFATASENDNNIDDKIKEQIYNAFLQNKYGLTEREINITLEIS